MIVRYVKERGYVGPARDPSLTLGAAYIALAIEFRPTGQGHDICIQRESDGTPVLFPLALFEVVDPRIGSGWCLFDMGDSYFRLMPEEFGGDFWDRFNDGDTEAERIFAEVVRRLRAFHYG